MAKKKAAAAVDPKLQRWKKQGESLAKAKNGNQWAIADWMCKGEGDFKRSKPYQVAAIATGMTLETLRQFAHTARNVLTRVNGLSFGHHRLVAQYSSEEQKRFLKHAKDNKESVASFAAFLNARKKDAARRAEKRSHADVAASKVMEAFDALLRNYHFEILLDKPPSPAARAELIERLKSAVAGLNTKVEQMATAWREHDEADAAFLRASSQEENAMGVGAGK
jgi:hypothetical protein